MKKKLVLLIAISMTMTLFVGCGEAKPTNTENDVESSVESVEETKEEVEAPHEHNFVEEITKEATCLEAGEKTLTCECGETKTEVIEAIGHIFENYVSNEDATYTADGTETAKCNNCEETDTRVAEGSMLTYTFEEMDATKYAKDTVNLRDLPSSETGEKIGALNLNDEVKVTGKCNETGWYRIEYSDGVAYVSGSYLVDSKVETKPATTTSSGGASAAATFPYEMYTVYNNGSVAWFYMTHNHGYSDTYWAVFNACHDLNKQLCGGCPSAELQKAAAAELGLTYNIGNDKTPWKTPDGEQIWIYYAW